jgi:hypothetical protein
MTIRPLSEKLATPPPVEEDPIVPLLEEQEAPAIRPVEGQQVGLGMYLHNGERHVVAKTAHVRLPELPEHAPARFAVGKGRTS